MNIDKLKQLAKDIAETNPTVKSEIDNAIYSYNNLERKNSDLQASVKSLQGQLADKVNIIRKYDELDRYKKNLETFEQQLLEREKKMAVNECNYKVQEAEKRVAISIDLFKTVFTSDLWKKVITENRTEVFTGKDWNGRDKKEGELKTTTVITEENKK